MTSLETFPKILDEGDLTAYEREVLQWHHDFEIILKERIAYHERMIDHWENKIKPKDPLYAVRMQIASEWRVSLGTLKQILGDDTPMPKFPDDNEETAP